MHYLSSDQRERNSIDIIKIENYLISLQCIANRSTFKLEVQCMKPSSACCCMFKSISVYIRDLVCLWLYGLVRAQRLLAEVFDYAKSPGPNGLISFEASAHLKCLSWMARSEQQSWMPWIFVVWVQIS